MLAPLPDLKQFQRLGLLKFPRNISPLMSYYATSSKFRQPAWCPVDLCQTLKKEDLDNSNLENTDLENTDLENTDLENVVYVLLEKPLGSCANNFLCVISWSCEPLDGLRSPLSAIQNFHSPFLFLATFFFFNTFLFFRNFFCRDFSVATFFVVTLSGLFCRDFYRGLKAQHLRENGVVSDR